jgi:HPt (histidine-containing phosphotransfer) domain-containing protein
MSPENQTFELLQATEQIKISQAAINLIDMKMNSSTFSNQQLKQFWQSIDTEKYMIEEALEEIDKIQLARKALHSNN